MGHITGGLKEISNDLLGINLLALPDNSPV